jgi:hypothetical protein
MECPFIIKSEFHGRPYYTPLYHSSSALAVIIAGNNVPHSALAISQKEEAADIGLTRRRPSFTVAGSALRGGYFIGGFICRQCSGVAARVSALSDLF